MKIAIVGSGVSGLSAAYFLARHHQVVLFEKNSRLGGHAHTIYTKAGSKNIPVDNGFMVFNPERYPNFIQLLNRLNVDYVPTEMSFSVTIKNEIAYSSNIPSGLFAYRKNLVNIRFWKVLIEILRFRMLAKKTLRSGKHKTDTLDQFMSRYKLSRDLANWFVFPMLSAIWSMKDTDKVGNFPAFSTFTFLDNHRLLDNSQPTWQTLPGGSVKYVSKMEQQLKKMDVRIVLNAAIENIKRKRDEVQILLNREVESFDYVLFATHADTTKKLISDLTEEEDKALSKFVYSTNKTILHSDTSFIPDNPSLLASWNFIQEKTADNKYSPASFTYCMNKLQHISMSTPMLVTLNPSVPVDKKYIHLVEEYTHPQYSLESLEGQKLISSLQGIRRTLYAGAHLGYGFHEDGLVSAINAVKKLGIDPPWKIK